MNSLLGLIIQILDLYQFILLIYIISTWLISFKVVNTSNRMVYAIMGILYRLCEPSLRLIRQYLPNLGTVDISPIVIYMLLWFLKSLIIEYWPR